MIGRRSSDASPSKKLPPDSLDTIVTPNHQSLALGRHGIEGREVMEATQIESNTQKRLKPSIKMKPIE